MKTLLIYSGGLDSTVLLYVLKKLGDELRAVSFNYGQKHKKELLCASVLCRRLQVPHTVIEFPSLSFYLPGSSQTDDSIAVPEGHYAAENMKTTVVPNRNMMMLAIAAGIGLAHDFNRVAFAAHAGDHTIYPDCRREFVDALEKALWLADWKRIGLYAPFLDSTKAQIVFKGGLLGVPFEQTWSCYKGGDLACGKCGTCVERLEAFKLAGVTDPLPYDMSSL